MNRQQNPVYQGYLVQFMSYSHALQYDNDTVFEQETLQYVTPDDVTRWMCVKCFGVEFPEPEDSPSLCRSTSLEVYKKALSWYMPNRIQAWDCINKTGNPTKSKEVNELIKHVKKRKCESKERHRLRSVHLLKQSFVQFLYIFLEKAIFNIDTGAAAC